MILGKTECTLKSQLIRKTVNNGVDLVVSTSGKHTKEHEFEPTPYIQLKKKISLVQERNYSAIAEIRRPILQ